MNKVPVTIIAGFLGSGKTTLLNHVLTSEHGLKIAVLVNDFGEINIDSQLITNVEGETISLANGCVCCTIRDDLARAVRELVDSGENYEYIITETSGVSEPAAAVMGLVMPPDLSAKIQIDAIITVVDAEQVLELEGESLHLAIDQLESADIVVINKKDLVDTEKLIEVKKWIQTRSPQARIVDAEYGQVPLPVLINTGVHNPPGARNHDAHIHDKTFSTWHMSENRALVFQAIYEFFKSLPLSVFRGKGFLNLDEVPDRQVVVQMVGKRVTISKGEKWGEKERSSDIVLIANSDDHDQEKIAEQFKSCLATGAARAPNRLADAVIEILRA
ncbi:MAG: GTP-binding protein [Gammaproteobacteria bacterium]|jgi:G3E family GTPase|nr:GTP-binding protein [Gammaproteobacteria bacterium]